MTDLTRLSVGTAARNEPLRERSLADELQQRLHKGILDGELQPGQRLGEANLGRRFQVSQATVREALNKLAAQGLVLQFRRKGTFVATVSEAEARHAYDIREALEPLAIRQAMQSEGLDLVRTVTRDLAAMKHAAGEVDLATLVANDMAFHRHVWQASGIDLLAHIWGLIEVKIRAFTAVSNRIYFGDLTEIASSHEPLVAALKSGDPELASRAFAEHAEVVWSRIRQPDAGLQQTR